MKNFTLSILVLLISFSVFAQNITDSDNYAKSVQNVPLFEEFTSSTCPPCATFNTFFTPWINDHYDDITVIKYQMSWPGSGDPYYTAEGGVRRGFYGVSYVPDLYTGGSQTGTNSGAVNAAYNSEMSKPAYFTINATHQVNGDFITVQTDILPENNESNITVQMAVIEKLTTGNVGSNGETEFHNVMMKMLPDAEGTTIDFNSNVHSFLSETFDMSSTFVEEMDDLDIVVFIQNNDTKEVLQSGYSVESSLPAPNLSFLPTDGATDIEFETDIKISFNQYMRFVNNTDITNGTISNFVSLTDPSKADIPFTATINASKSVITLVPDSYLPESSLITVSIDDAEIEGINNIPLSGISSSFSTPSYPLPGISFDPVNGSTDVSFDTEIILTFNMFMRNSNDSEITDGDINTFITLTDPSKANIAFSGTINAQKTMITITPDTYLPELEDITVTLVGDMIENVYDIPLAESFSTFTTGSYPAANLVFSPFDGEDNVGITRNVTLTFDHAMRMLDDSEITNGDISSFITLTDPTKGDIAYTGMITSSKDLIVLNPDENLPELTDITVTVADNVIENIFDNALAGSSATFTTEDAGSISALYANIKIYPNPANNYFNISGAKNSKIEVLDISGRVVFNKIILTDTDQIVIENLDSGIYILRIITDTIIVKKKISIVK